MCFRIKKWKCAIYFVVLVALSLFVIRCYLKSLSRPLPIAKDNVPPMFLIVGASADGEYSLLTLYEYSSAIQKAEVYYENKDAMKKHYRLGSSEEKVLWPEDIPKYNYYITEKDLLRITENINKTFREKFETITIKILDSDEVAKKQTIFIDKWQDDYNFYFVYEVTDNKVVPLRYGDLVKSDGVVAFGAGFFTFVAGLVAFLVFMAVNKFWLIKEKPNE